MLQIRLRKQPSESSSGAGGSAAGGAHKSLPFETVTVACPDHLVLADLLVAKGIGAATAATSFKSVGRRSRRQLGERVHFCVRCDFPIAIYGRLVPCDHAFCLDCARSDSICYLCDERIQKIQTIKMMEGIFICAAPHCLKSFLKRTDFENHIQGNHADLLQPNAEKEDGIESEVQSSKQPTPDSRATLRSIISPASNPQLLDEDKARWQQHPRQTMQSKPPFFGQPQNYPSDTQPENSQPPGFDRPGSQSHIQQNIQRESGQFTEKQQGSFPEAPMPEYPPMHPVQPPNFGMPMNANSFMPQFSLPPFHSEGAQPVYGTPYEMSQMVRADSAPDLGSEQGLPLGVPPCPASNANLIANCPQPWNTGGAPGGQGNADGFGNQSDSHGNIGYNRGDYLQNPGGLAPPLPSNNKGMEAVQASNAMDPRDGKGLFPLLPPFTSIQLPPHLPHPSQSKRHEYFHNDMGHDGQGF